MTETEKLKKDHEKIHQLIRKTLIDKLESGEADDKMLAVALRYLKEHQVETLEDAEKHADMAEVADSLPFRKTAKG